VIKGGYPTGSMSNRPAAVTVVAWLVMVFSAAVTGMFVLRILSFDSYEITSVSLVFWWFALGLFPLYFLSGLFVLRGRGWARELCVAGGVSSVLFGLVVAPRSVVVVGAAAFVIASTVILYRAHSRSFFARPRGLQRRLSVASFFAGMTAAGMAATAAYAHSVNYNTGMSLNWLTKMGLVTQPSTGGEASITETSIFAINDENALVFLTSLAIVLAVAAMALALVAEYRREPTLYLSAGYLCGALALLIFKPVIGFACMVAGTFAILMIRHTRRERERAADYE
jgi:hypothetical protein